MEPLTELAIIIGTFLILCTIGWLFYKKTGQSDRTRFALNATEQRRIAPEHQPLVIQFYNNLLTAGGLNAIDRTSIRVLKHGSTEQDGYCVSFTAQIPGTPIGTYFIMRGVNDNFATTGKITQIREIAYDRPGKYYGSPFHHRPFLTQDDNIIQSFLTHIQAHQWHPPSPCSS